MMPSFEQAIQMVHQLPSIPEAVQQVLGYLDDEYAEQSLLERAIARDQALVARLLQLANSPFYGGANQIQSIHEAVVVLGISNLRMIVVATMLTTQKFPGKLDELLMQTMFRHSISVGICAYVLGRRNQVNPNQAFLAGILHDVGKLALASSYPEIYAEARMLHQKEDILMVDAEQHVFGFDHAAIGAALCSHWRFPKEICDAIGGHHRLADSVDSVQTPMASTPLMEVVHLANVVAHALNLESDMQSSVPRISEAAWTNLTSTKEKLVNDFSDMQGMYKKLTVLVNL